jgi:hypothetical protein
LCEQNAAFIAKQMAQTIAALSGMKTMLNEQNDLSNDIPGMAVACLYNLVADPERRKPKFPHTDNI